MILSLLIISLPVIALTSIGYVLWRMWKDGIIQQVGAGLIGMIGASGI